MSFPLVIAVFSTLALPFWLFVMWRAIRRPRENTRVAIVMRLLYGLAVLMYLVNLGLTWVDVTNG